jgi:hypothetical protein
MLQRGRHQRRTSLFTNAVAVVVGTLSTVLGTLLVLPLTKADPEPTPVQVQVEVVVHNQPRYQPGIGCRIDRGAIE